MTADVEYAFEGGDVATAAGDNQQHRPTLGIPFVEDGRETALRRSTAEERGNLEARRKAAAAHVRLGCVALIRAEQHRRQCITAARAAHLFKRRLVARDAADCGQRLQMLGAGVGRRQEEEDEIHRLAIDRLEVDRFGEAVDYKAIDGRPVDLVFLLLSPPDSGAEHLKALASISRVTRNVATLEKMRGARSRDALAAVLIGADERDAA